MAPLLKGEIRTATIPQATGIPGVSGFCHVLIISNDHFNHRSDVVFVLPIDHDEGNFDLFDSMRLHTAENIRSPAWVRLDQVRTLSDDRIGNRVDSVNPEEVLSVLRAFNQRLL